MNENEIGTRIVDVAVRLHKELGPGLLESVYERVLASWMQKEGFEVKRQVPIQIRIGDESFDEGFRADLVIGDSVIIELKSIEQIAPVHRKQLQTYLKLSGKKLGFLLNFGAALMKDGIVRAVNRLPE